MLLTNSQNNIERSAIDAALKHSDYDVLSSKGESVQFDKKFGPLLTYCPADNLIYYIGYEHEPTGNITTDKQIQRRVFGLDLEDSSPYKHPVTKMGGPFLDPAQSPLGPAGKGSLSLSGEGDYLLFECVAGSASEALTQVSRVKSQQYGQINPDSFGCPEIFGSHRDAYGDVGSRWPLVERGLPADGELTVEFWIRPRELDGIYDYQTIIQHGWAPTDAPNGADDTGPDTNAAFGVYIGAGGSDWTKGKIYVRGTGATLVRPAPEGQDYTLDLKSTTNLTEGTWYHIAIEKQTQTGADLVTLYINGIPEATDSWTTTTNFPAYAPTFVGVQIFSPSGSPDYIRSSQALASWETNHAHSPRLPAYGYFNGHIDELRVSLKAMYKAKFYALLRTTQLEIQEEYFDMSNTQMLIQGDQGAPAGSLMHIASRASATGGTVNDIWSDENFIYTAEGNYGGLNTYSVDESGNLSRHSGHDPHYASGAQANGVWGDGNFIYLAAAENGDPSGLHSYSVDGSGNLTHIDNHKPYACWGQSVWGDGNFIYMSCSQSGGAADALHSYSVDGSGNLTHIDSVASAPGAEEIFNIWGDGNFIYCTAGTDGLHTYSVDGSGNLTPIDSDSQGSSYYSRVYGDGNFIYVTSPMGLLSYSVDGSGNLTYIDTGTGPMGEASGPGGLGQVWSDGNLIYMIDMDDGLVSFSVDGSGNLTFIDSDDQGGTYNLGLYGDGNYIYAGHFPFGSDSTSCKLLTYSVGGGDGLGVNGAESWIVDKVGNHTFRTAYNNADGQEAVNSLVPLCDGPGGRCGYFHFNGGAYPSTNPTGITTEIKETDEFRFGEGTETAQPVTIEFWFKFKEASSMIADPLYNQYKDVIIAEDCMFQNDEGWTLSMERGAPPSNSGNSRHMRLVVWKGERLEIWSKNGMKDGQWHHIALTIEPDGVDDSTWKFYIDGLLQGSIMGVDHPMPHERRYHPSATKFRIGHGSLWEWGGQSGEGHYGNFYLDDLRWTTAIVYPDEFEPPKTRLPLSNGLTTSLMMHFDSQEDVTETTTTFIEDGGYGLCTFNPLTLDTETVLKFDEPQYKDEDLGRTISIADGCGDTWRHNRTYNIPRDIVYSAYDNCLWLLFNKHEQFYRVKTVCTPTEEYAGMDGYTENYFTSESRFILYKYDLSNRNITYSKTLWTISWNDDSLLSGWYEIALMKDVMGLNNKYFHYPEFLRHMFTSLSINPRSGEVIALHSNKGWGYQNLSYGSYSYEGAESGMFPPELSKTPSEGIVSVHCPTNKKCANSAITNDTNAIWGMDSHGESWHFTTKLNDGSDQTIPSANFVSNNCMVYSEPTGHISQETWTLGPCEDDPTQTCSFISTISRPFETGGNPKKLIFCPSTGSYYIPSKSGDAWVDFLYEELGGRREVSDNFNLLNAPSPPESVEDGIYVPSMDKILYLTYAGGEPGLIYVNACRPSSITRNEFADRDIESLAVTEGLCSNQTVYGRNGFGGEITSPQSLIYCPSNDRIYLLGLKTLLKIRPFNLSIEESYNVPTGENMKEGMGLKTFIPVYSHVNDVIYYMSNDNQRQSFCFKPNY